MRRLFSRFDKDASGRLNRQELQRATEMLGDRFGDEDTAILLSIIDKVVPCCFCCFCCNC